MIAKLNIIKYFCYHFRSNNDDDDDDDDDDEVMVVNDGLITLGTKGGCMQRCEVAE